MAMTDPLGDLLTRIRNGQQARKDSVLTPASKLRTRVLDVLQREGYIRGYAEEELAGQKGDRKSTRLNSSHLVISYAVFCLKKKNIYLIRYVRMPIRICMKIVP